MTPGFNANVSEQYQAHLTFEQVQAKALSELTSSSLLVHPPVYRLSTPDSG